MSGEENLKPTELGGYKVKDNIWFLDKKGKCRSGIILGLGITPQNEPYASVFDHIDLRNVTLLIEKLSSRPLEGAKSRVRSASKKDRKVK